MDAPSPEDVRRALAEFDVPKQKVVAGLLTVMVKNSTRVREREWIARQLTEVVLLAVEFDAETPDAGVRTVQEFIQDNAAELLNATYLLFQRVGLDLASRTETGFSFEEAMRIGLAYFPSRTDVPG